MDIPGKQSAPTTPDLTTSEAADGNASSTERTRRRSSARGTGSIVAAAWSLLLAKGVGLASGLAVCCFLVWNALADVVVGRVEAVGAGVLTIGEADVQLWGLRPLPLDARCVTGDTQWACGAYAYSAMYLRAARRSAWCVVKGHSGNAVQAQCFTGVADVGNDLVQGGWAAADESATTRYASAERAARQAGRGVWAATREASSGM